MLTLKKMSNNSLRLLKYSVGPYEFSPKNVLYRVNNSIPHPKYVANALMGHLRETWHASMLDAVSSGDHTKEDYYKELLRSYPSNAFNNPDEVRRLFRDDPAWPFPYDRTPSAESKEKITGIPRTPDGSKGVPSNKPTDTYLMEDTEKIQHAIENAAIELEKEQAHLMVEDSVHKALESKGITPNAVIPFSDRSKRKQQMIEQGEDVPEEIFIDADTYNDMVQRTVEHLITSPLLFKGETQYKEPFQMGKEVSPDSLYDSFSNYISRIIPAFVNRYVDDVVVGQQTESLDDPAYSDEGREESRIEKVEDPKAFPAVETGAGIISPELDILSGLEVISRGQNMPIEQYLNSSAFKMHSLLQLLKPMWQEQIDALSGTPGNEEQIRNYKRKLLMSSDALKISTPDALRDIIDDNDITMLGADPKTVFSTIDSNKNKYLGEILWDNVLARDGRPSTEKSTFLKSFQRILDEKPSDVSFDQLLDVKQNEYQQGMGDEGAQQGADKFQQIVDKVQELYGPKAQELLRIYFDVMKLPRDARGDDVAGYVADIWNERNPEKKITSLQVNKFLDTKVKSIIDSLKSQPIETEPSETSTEQSELDVIDETTPQPPVSNVSPAVQNPHLVRWNPGEDWVHSQWPKDQGPFMEDPTAVEQYKKVLREGLGLSLRHKKISLRLRSKSAV